jgi:hypothetical protein
VLRSLVALVLIMLLTSAGCGVRPVTGGTPGRLLSEGTPVAEMQVAVFQNDGAHWQQIGFGVTAGDGTFALVKNQAQGPLVLSPGEYRFTLESVGAPVTFPAAYANPSSTPLQITWPTPEQRLELAAPIVLVPQS